MTRTSAESLSTTATRDAIPAQADPDLRERFAIAWELWIGARCHICSSRLGVWDRSGLCARTDCQQEAAALQAHNGL